MVALLGVMHSSRTVQLRWRQWQDLDAIVDFVHRELQRAGARTQWGPSGEHDPVTVEAGERQWVVRYRSDSWGASRSGAASLRWTDAALQWRAPGASGYQALHDPASTALPVWRVTEAPSAPCGTGFGLEWALMPITGSKPSRAVAGPAPFTVSGWVRRRNGPPLPCEALPATGRIP